MVIAMLLRLKFLYLSLPRSLPCARHRHIWSCKDTAFSCNDNENDGIFAFFVIKCCIFQEIVIPLHP